MTDPHAAVLDDVVGKETKIVWRMGGQGDIRLSATGPGGVSVEAKEVQAHGGSTWKRPGDEWGSLWTFSRSGCWRLHAERDDVRGDIWLLVQS
jgi:hypothetical protein